MKITEEQVLSAFEALDEIAQKYCDLYYTKDQGAGCITMYPSVRRRDLEFSFTIGPVTSGIGQTITLPTSLVENWTEEKLQGFVDERRQRNKEIRERNTCKECGHDKRYKGFSYNGLEVH